MHLFITGYNRLLEENSSYIFAKFRVIGTKKWERLSTFPQVNSVGR